jgi:hypothetical protein
MPSDAPCLKARSTTPSLASRIRCKTNLLEWARSTSSFRPNSTDDTDRRVRETERRMSNLATALKWRAKHLHRPNARAHRSRPVAVGSSALVTPSEQLVFDLCRKTALSLWSYANPRRIDGKELCDALIVFGDDIVIFSVKEVVLNEKADPEVAAKRWEREAVTKSVDQLIGARRYLDRLEHVIKHDGSPGVALPPPDKRRVHLVAVAVGGRRQVPIAGGNRNGGTYVHVMDEHALRVSLRELDTTPDFLAYLAAKEAFDGTIIAEGEENLLALYLQHNRTLPAEMHAIVVQDGMWCEFETHPQFKARKDADRVSYWWDNFVIEGFISDHDVSLEAGTTMSEFERVVRTMAAEDRLQRRMLSVHFLQWLERQEPGTRSFRSRSGVGYLFGTFPRDMDRTARQQELVARCYVARGPDVLDCPTVVGIATEVYDPTGYSLDGAYLHIPDWGAAQARIAQEARQHLRIMESPRYLAASVAEYPTPSEEALSRAERNRRKRERRARRGKA